MAPAIALRPWLILLPPLLLLGYDTPEDTGLRPDGGAAPTQAQGPSAIDGLGLRTPTVSLLAADWLAISMLVTTLHFYQASVLTL